MRRLGYATAPHYAPAGILTVKTTQIIKSEVLNASLPASTFVFKAPKGFKAQE